MATIINPSGRSLFFSLAALFLFSRPADSRTIHVGSTHAHSSITAALVACEDGDTVIVSKGVYKEGNLVIDKSICLLGEGMPVLDGENKYEVLSVKKSDVTIRGAAHSEFGPGIHERPRRDQNL